MTTTAYIAILKQAGHQGFVKGVAWDPISRYLASAGDDRAVIVWRVGGSWGIEATVTQDFTSKVSSTASTLSTLYTPHSVETELYIDQELLDSSDTRRQQCVMQCALKSVFSEGTRCLMTTAHNL
jgi:hypothetical protein